MVPPHAWLDRVIRSAALDLLVERLGNSTRVAAEGSQGSSTALVAGAVAMRTGRPVLLVVPHLDDADDALDDLELFPTAGHALPSERFGAMEVLPGESNVSLDLLAERLAVVAKWSVKSPGIAMPGLLVPSVLVAPIQALMQAVPEPKSLYRFSLTLEKGQDLAPARLMDWLTGAGYSRVDAVEQPGEFAARGGIVDIFPPTGDAKGTSGGASGGSGGWPVRLDYFGDQIETIRRIDPETMGSGTQLDQFRIIGANPNQLQSDDETTSLLALLPPEVIVVMQEVLELSEQGRGYYERLTNPRGIYSPAAVFQAIARRPHVEVNQYSAPDDRGKAVTLPVRPLMAFDREAGKAVVEVAELGKDGSRVVVLCPMEAERYRLLELIAEHAAGAAVEVEVGYLHRGFVWDLEPSPSPDEIGMAGRGQGEGTSDQGRVHETGDQGTLKAPSPQPSPMGRGGELVLIPHQELFHRYHTRRRIRRITPTVGAASGTRTADAFLDVAVGDYVVHNDHGIALFRGLKTMKKEGKSEEYLTLEFADAALLHVPATQIDLVQKYIGGFHGRPPLSTLGGKRWQNQKNAVSEAVKDMAAEMLRVQAARASTPGVRFPPDTAWQKEFEAEFPYEETPDQLAAIGELKRDMADDRPMDRLICGDVGFGKTEVAIRAAFKAAEFGKQVAVLVPTTVLAEQHERTFRGRFADYPFRVESISRFKNDAEQREVLKGVKNGQIDVVIGTHRLLSKDVDFADLGLVIIDEEQRFGVEHKQKLMQFRLTVDVLTLSATPIPRTLHMAMLGLRDISSLTTPPLDRRAIVTEVIPYDEGRIRRAILREMAREGQTYFVHNRVHDIQTVADNIHRLVPDARIIVGHGQMAGHELEDVMLRFVRREVDVLVSTTIIESGLDIPTANTIFIDQSDHFGLADLHQLRGRVGRYKHRAYCYLLLPQDRPLTDVATQRLSALEQYSMLGAGFKIAMRDLEIRGAGNLLGAEQSGHIAAVGYDMYCHLLEQETHNLRNEKPIAPIKTHVELPISGSLPKTYIGSDKFRMEAYRRLSRAASLEELDAVTRDLADAYGKPPEAAQALIDMTEIRIAAATLEVKALKLDGPDLIFRTEKPALLEPIFKTAPGRASVIDETTVYYRPPLNYLEPATLAAVLRKLLVRPLRGSEASRAVPARTRCDTPRV